MFNSAQKGANMVSKIQNDSTSFSRRFLRLADVKQQVGLGRSAIYQKVKSGDFPAPVNLGARAVAWVSDEVDAWVDRRIKASRTTQGGVAK
jgi:prophage regulatory protein